MNNDILPEKRDNWYVRWTSSPMNLILLTVAWVVFLFAISPLAGIPWGQLGDFDFRTLMYYHAIMLPLVGLLICLVCVTMGLGGDVKRLLQYSLIPAIILNGVGSMFIYSVNDLVPLWMQIVGFFVLDEMAVALIYGLFVLPRKMGVRYTRMGMGYYVVTTSVCSSFIAALLGHIGGVGVDWGLGVIPGITGYLTSIGVSSTDFTANVIVSHSHEMLPAVMGGIAALTMTYFGYETSKGFRHWLASIALWIMEAGVLSMTFVYLYSAITNWAVPAIFTSADGANGLAFDDLLTGIVGIGALVGLVAILFIPTERALVTRPTLNAKDPLRVAMLMSWIVAFISVLGIGYPIEFNEVFYQGAGIQNDLAFTRTHLMLGFFVMPIMAGILLALDLVYRRTNTSSYPTYVAPVAVIGMALTLAGQYIWVDSLSSLVFFIGFGVLVFDLLLVGVYMYQMLKAQAHFDWEKDVKREPARNQLTNGRKPAH